MPEERRGQDKIKIRGKGQGQGERRARPRRKQFTRKGKVSRRGAIIRLKQSQGVKFRTTKEREVEAESGRGRERLPGRGRGKLCFQITLRTKVVELMKWNYGLEEENEDAEQGNVTRRARKHKKKSRESMEK